MHITDLQKQLISFSEELSKKRQAIWEDENGTYAVLIGNSILNGELEMIKPQRIYFSEKLRRRDLLDKKWDYNSHSKTIVSIGSFQPHNQARIECGKHSLNLITVPVPISNDSFCTNRCSSQLHVASQKCVFPQKTIIDLDLLMESCPGNVNALGYGEALGLYTSVLDYCFTHNSSIPTVLLQYLVNQCRIMEQEFQRDQKQFLTLLATVLVLKCLVMRINNDHQIGCGCDHSLALALEDELEIPHGCAVLLGVIISLKLFPNWQEYGLRKSEVISRGRKLNLIDADLIFKLNKLDFSRLLVRSKALRPNRPSLLHNVDIAKLLKGGSLWELLN